MNKPLVDWEPLRQYGPSIVTCECGAVYRSLNKLVGQLGTLVTVTELPCPGCGKDYGHARSVSSDWDRQTITKSR